MKLASQLSDAKILKDSQYYPWMFGTLVDRYQDAFLRKGLYILRSQDDAEDAVQDTFIKIYKNAHKFSEKRNASFQSWAYKILINTCYDYASQKIVSSNRIKLMDFSDDKSYEEIASLEHISISAVRSGLYRARKQFKDLALKMI